MIEPDRPNQPSSGDRASKALSIKRLIAITLISSLGIFLLAAFAAWRAEVDMGLHGHIAMALGILFSMALGIGLMALLFYSARHGYDDGPIGVLDDAPSNTPDDRSTTAPTDNDKTD